MGSLILCLQLKRNINDKKKLKPTRVSTKHYNYALKVI